MSNDSKQIGVDKTAEDDPDDAEASHPHIRQLGIEVPEDWEETPIGEIGELDTSSVDKKSNPGEDSVNLVNYMDVYENYIIDSEIDYMKVTAPESQIERSQVLPGDILFTPSSEEPGDIGNSAVVTEEMENTLHSYHTVRLRPKSGNTQLDTGFSGWLANAPYVSKQFARRATGSTRYTLTLDDFSDTQVLVPLFSEQRKIASVLYTVNQAIQKTEEIVDQSERVKKGVRQDLLTRGMAEADGLRSPPEKSPEEYEDARNWIIPRSWELKQLSDVCSLQVGYAFKSDWYRDSGEVRVLRGANVGYGKPDWSDTKYLESERVGEYEEYRLDSGDIVIGMDRPYTSSGFKISRLSERDVPSLLVQRVGCYRPEEIRQDYLHVVLNDWRYQKQLLRRAQGMDIPHISKTDILSPKIPVPPRKEQERIAEVFTTLREQVESERNYRIHLKSLKRGLMQDLLSGAVRTHDTEIEVVEEVLQHG